MPPCFPFTLKVCWNPVNGHWLASGSKDQTMRVYDVRSLKEPLQLIGQEKDVSVAPTPFLSPNPNPLLTRLGFLLGVNLSAFFSASTIKKIDSVRPSPRLFPPRAPGQLWLGTQRTSVS